jgi:hypothetical protein
VGDVHAASKIVGTRMYPRSGCHEFQLSPCSFMSNPDSIAACEGSVDACRMVCATSDHEPLCMIPSCTGG